MARDSIAVQPLGCMHRSTATSMMRSMNARVWSSTSERAVGARGAPGSANRKSSGGGLVSMMCSRYSLKIVDDPRAVYQFHTGRPTAASLLGVSWSTSGRTAKRG